MEEREEEEREEVLLLMETTTTNNSRKVAVHSELFRKSMVRHYSLYFFTIHQRGMWSNFFLGNK